MSPGAIFAILVAVAFVSVLVVAILIAITRSTSLRAAERDLANERKRQLEQILQRQNATKQKDAGSVDGTDRNASSLQEMEDSVTVLFASHQAAQQMGPNPSSPFAGLTVARMSKMVPPLTFVDGTTNSTSLGTVSIETKSPIRLFMAARGSSRTCYFVMDEAGTVSVSDVGNSLTCRAGDPPTIRLAPDRRLTQ